MSLFLLNISTFKEIIENKIILKKIDAYFFIN